MPIYEDFSAPELDPGRWNARPAAGFGACPTQLEIGCTAGQCSLRLHLDPPGDEAREVPATIHISTKIWPVGREPMDFSTTMAASVKSREDACAAFGIIDAETGTVIGVASTGAGLIAIARSEADPLAPLSVGALEFTDLGVITSPMRRHDVRIEYDPVRRIARWYIDEVMQLYRVLPLRQLGGAPLAAYGEWGPIQYDDESELGPDPMLGAQAV
jgi:hypothetical protein